MKIFVSGGGPLLESQAWHMKRWADVINGARDMTDTTYAINLIVVKIPKVVNIHQRKNRAVQYRNECKRRQDWSLGPSLDRFQNIYKAESDYKSRNRL